VLAESAGRLRIRNKKSTLHHPYNCHTDPSAHSFPPAWAFVGASSRETGAEKAEQVRVHLQPIIVIDEVKPSPSIRPLFANPSMTSIPSLPISTRTKCPLSNHSLSFPWVQLVGMFLAQPSQGALVRLGGRPYPLLFFLPLLSRRPPSRRVAGSCGQGLDG
jgi:hypothetical protein